MASAIQKKKAEQLSPDGPLLPFVKWFFPLREDIYFLEGPHHELLCKTLDRTLTGEISRLLITLPPGYTKTEIAVINYMAKGFMVNPASRFIHATYSEELARENSEKTKSLIELPEFQALRSVELRSDTRAKDRWKTKQGGGLLAKAAGGPITGFRAGYMDKERFTGALIVDDPLKPDDAFSPTERAKVNRRATNTFRSRLAHDGVPIIVIMQRLHSDDFAGHLLTGGMGDKFHHLDLSVIVDHNAEYPKEWTHGIPISHDLPEGPLWPFKHSTEEIEVLKHDAYTFASQYMGRPVTAEGVLFDMDSFQYWSELPPMDYYRIYADTAQKKGQRNDYSVFQLWGKGKDGNIYLIDQIRGKWEASELEKNAQTFWHKHSVMGKLNVRGMKIEDKVSGTGLIQKMSSGKRKIPVYAIKRQRDKYTRGLDAAPWITAKAVYLPKEASFINSLKHELQIFDGLGTGFDDQVDPLMDAIEDMLGKRSYVDPEAYKKAYGT